MIQPYPRARALPVSWFQFATKASCQHRQPRCSSISACHAVYGACRQHPDLWSLCARLQPGLRLSRPVIVRARRVIRNRRLFLRNRNRSFRIAVVCGYCARHRRRPGDGGADRRVGDPNAGHLLCDGYAGAGAMCVLPVLSSGRLDRRREWPAWNQCPRHQYFRHQTRFHQSADPLLCDRGIRDRGILCFVANPGIAIWRGDRGGARKRDPRKSLRL